MVGLQFVLLHKADTKDVELPVISKIIFQNLKLTSKMMERSAKKGCAGNTNPIAAGSNRLIRIV